MDELLKKIEALTAQAEKNNNKDEVTALQNEIKTLTSKFENLEKQQLENQARGNGPVPTTNNISSFAAFARKGEISDTLTESGTNDGGVLIPIDVQSGIDKDVAENSAILEISQLRTTSTDKVSYHVRTEGYSAGHVGETEDRTTTGTAKYQNIDIPLGAVYADPEVSNSLLDDNDENLASEITSGVGEALGGLLAKDFIDGDGTKGPKGILSYTQKQVVKKSELEFGKLGFYPTGVAGALPVKSQWKIFRQAKRCIKSGYLKKAHWIMNSTTAGILDGLEDANGNPLWKDQDGLVKDSPSTFCGVTVKIDENMPDISSGDVFCLLMGSKAYQPIRHKKATIIRDSITHKGFTQFYNEQRWGGGLRNFWAIIGIKGVAKV
jgi:HK97 family phage major capsid protein